MEVREPVVAYGKTKLSVEEYLDWERSTERKHEFHKGTLFAMPAHKFIHNIIAVNLLGSLVVRGKDRNCEFFGGDRRIHIPQDDFFTYPDISIVCPTPVTLNEDGENILNPAVVVEVLSPSTRHYDPEEKFQLYRDIPTLQEYILVDSETVGITAWRIDERKEWAPEEYHLLGESLYLPVISLNLPLAEIYEGTYLALS